MGLRHSPGELGAAGQHSRRSRPCGMMKPAIIRHVGGVDPGRGGGGTPLATAVKSSEGIVGPAPRDLLVMLLQSQAPGSLTHEGRVDVDRETPVPARLSGRWQAVTPSMFGSIHTARLLSQHHLQFHPECKKSRSSGPEVVSPPCRDGPRKEPKASRIFGPSARCPCCYI